MMLVAALSSSDPVHVVFFLHCKPLYASCNCLNLGHPDHLSKCQTTNTLFLCQFTAELVFLNLAHPAVLLLSVSAALPG